MSVYIHVNNNFTQQQQQQEQQQQQHEQLEASTRGATAKTFNFNIKDNTIYSTSHHKTTQLQTAKMPSAQWENSMKQTHTLINQCLATNNFRALAARSTNHTTNSRLPQGANLTNLLNTLVYNVNAIATQAREYTATTQRAMFNAPNHPYERKEWQDDMENQKEDAKLYLRELVDEACDDAVEAVWSIPEPLRDEAAKRWVASQDHVLKLVERVHELHSRVSRVVKNWEVDEWRKVAQWGAEVDRMEGDVVRRIRELF